MGGQEAREEAAGLPRRWPMSRYSRLMLLAEAALHGCLIGPWLAGRWGVCAALVGVVGLVFGVRLVIALASRTATMYWGSPLPPGARLRPWGWLRYFGREYRDFCLHQLVFLPGGRCFRSRGDRGALRPEQTGEVLLLQHGYANNGAVWWFTLRALERAGYRVFTLDQPPWVDIEEMAQRLELRVEAVLAATGAERLTLVVHSMGGLIARAYLRRAGGARVRRLITLGSPHQGTQLARVVRGRCAQQMRPGNAWLRALGEAVMPVPFTSVYSLHDTVVAPQLSSRLPGVTNVELRGWGHVSMLDGHFARVVLLPLLRDGHEGV